MSSSAAHRRSGVAGRIGQGGSLGVPGGGRPYQRVSALEQGDGGFRQGHGDPAQARRALLSSLLVLHRHPEEGLWAGRGGGRGRTPGGSLIPETFLSVNGGGGAPTRLCREKARGEAGPQREWGRPPERPGTTCPGKPAHPGQRGCLLLGAPSVPAGQGSNCAERGLNLPSPGGLVLRAGGHLTPHSTVGPLPSCPAVSSGPAPPAQLSRPRAPLPGRGDGEGRHLQGPTCRVAAGLGQDVGALAHEGKVPPVKGEVMRVSIDEAGGSACRGDMGDA